MMSKVKTDNLRGSALMFVVLSMLYGIDNVKESAVSSIIHVRFPGSNSWADVQVNPIFEREVSFILLEKFRFNIKNDGLPEKKWWVSYPDGNHSVEGYDLAETIQRCYVKSIVGDHVNIPLSLVHVCR